MPFRLPANSGKKKVLYHVPKIRVGWAEEIIHASFMFKFTNERIFDYFIKNFHLNTIFKNQDVVFYDTMINFLDDLV